MPAGRAGTRRRSDAGSATRWTALLALAVVIVLVAGVAPHIFLWRAVSGVDPAGTYSPALLNEHWARFDDLVKASPALALGLEGKFGQRFLSPFGDARFANFVQESLGTLLIAVPVAVSRSVAAPFYSLPFFVALTTVMIAVLVRPWFRDDVLAVCASLIVILGYQYLHIYDLAAARFGLDTWNAVIAGSLRNAFWEYNSFFRIHTMSATYPVFLGLLLYLDRYIAAVVAGQLPAGRWWVLGGGALIAAQFYAYFYYALVTPIMLAVAAFGIGVLAWRRNVSPFRAVWPLLLAGLIGALLALPSILDTLALLGAEHADFRARISGTASAAPFWANRHVLLLALVCLAAFAGQPYWSVFAGLFLSVLVIENLQVVFGANLQTGHVYSRVVVPLLAIAMLLLITRLAGLLPWRTGIWPLRALLACGAALFLATSLMWSASHAALAARGHFLTRDEQALTAWLRDNVRRGETVATLHANVNELVTLHGHAAQYQPFGGHLPVRMTNQEIMARLARVLWLARAEPADLDMLVQERGNANRIGYYHFQRVYAPLGPQPLAALAAGLGQAIARLEHDPQRAMADGAWPHYLVVGGPGHGPERTLGRAPRHATEAARFGDYIVHRVTAGR